MENSVAQIAQRLMENARAAKSPEDILALAEACHFGLTLEDAQRCFIKPTSSRELPDQELENVSGGYMEGESALLRSYPKPQQEVSPLYSCMEWSAPASSGPFLCATCEYCTLRNSSCVCGYGLPSL